MTDLAVWLAGLNGPRLALFAAGVTLWVLVVVPACIGLTNWIIGRRWAVTLVGAIACLAVTLVTGLWAYESMPVTRRVSKGSILVAISLFSWAWLAWSPCSSGVKFEADENQEL